LKALVKHRVNLEKWIGNEKALHIVASAGHKELTSWLVDNGAAVDCRTKDEGATPMMVAAKYGHAETIAELLLRDAESKKQDVSGRSWQSPLPLIYIYIYNIALACLMC
jgi:ankyrin repeat protein